ncbi:MAG TPA: lantibiotic dehydratase [Kofleriaceae bacterium]|nr:lantibiotic dehydratase [Kofleriaceae bacterium]
MRDDRVRDAAARTSRSLADGFARWLADGAPVEAGPASQIERRALLFLQRLTAKPAMLADAGPCLWGSLDRAQPAAVNLEVGAALVADRRVAFEHWAILAIARRIQADPEVAPHCVVRLNPGCLLDGSTLYYPIGHRLRLEPREAQVVKWCTEGKTLAELRQVIAARPADERGELGQLLANHLKSGVATHEIPVPTAPDPDQALRGFVAALPDACAGVPRWLAALDQLIALRDELARGLVGERRRAVEARLDAAFRELAGLPPTRNPGQHYGARFVTYEDSRRDVALTLGAPVARDLAALEPALELASWVARACADRYEQKLIPIHARLARNLNSVDFITFIRETQWITDTPEVAIGLRRELRDAWQAELGDRLVDDRPLALVPDDFRGVLARLEPHAGDGPWLPAADCHALSVDGAAASVEAWNAGHYALVLDKLYKGVPMWIHPATLPFCPDRAEALAAFEAWAREPILQLVDSAAAYHRSNFNLPVVGNLWEVTVPNTASRSPRERVVPCSELEVIQDRGRLYICSHDRRIRSGFFAVRWAFLQHKLLEIPVHPENPDLDHAFRVTMGRWVLAREHWRFDTAALARRWDRANPMPAIAAWQAEHGIPDRVFVKLPGEPSSIALDLRSVLYGDLLRALVASHDELRVTERWPGPDHDWLVDGAGAGYGAELRFSMLRRGDAATNKD